MANDGKDASKQRAILLSVCGAATYQLICNLVAPGKSTEKSFADLVKHHTPPLSVTVQQFKFNSRPQKVIESVAEFVAEIRQVSDHCQFEDPVDMLRDCLVCGISDSRVQRRLLAETNLTFKKAFELSLAAELAEQNSKDVQKPHSTAVHSVQKQASKPQSNGLHTNCYRCGGKHAAVDCRFKETECHYREGLP